MVRRWHLSSHAIHLTTPGVKFDTRGFSDMVHSAAGLLPRLLVLLLFLPHDALAMDPHQGHDHGQGDEEAEAHPWEWAGAFDLLGADKSRYTLVASVPKQSAAEIAKATASAADPHAGHDHGRRILSGSNAAAKYGEESMVFLLLNTSSADAAGIEAAEARAERLFNVTLANSVQPARNVVTPGEAINIVFNPAAPITVIPLQGFSKGPHVLFMQHAPAEMEGYAGHFFKDQTGMDVKAQATEPAAEQESASEAMSNKLRNAGQAIGASVVVSVIALIGLLMLVPLLFNKKVISLNSHGAVMQVAQLFASGALLATAFMFIFPETLNAFRLAYTGDSDAQQAAGLGGSALGGIFAGALLAMVTKLAGDKNKQNGAPGTENVANLEMTEKSAGGTDATAVTVATGDVERGSALVASTSFNALLRPFCECKMTRWSSTAWAVLVGDFLHNFADGVAIGVAFKTCDPAFGWIVATGTIAHEISQELADFMVLITRGQMSIGAALVANFLSGLAALLGTLISLYADLSHQSIGIILGFSGGVYCWVAIGECMAFAADNTKTKTDLVSASVSFVVGAVAIALVLLSHVHCESPAVAGIDPHAGHNH